MSSPDFPDFITIMSLITGMQTSKSFDNQEIEQQIHELISQLQDKQQLEKILQYCQNYVDNCFEFYGVKSTLENICFLIIMKLQTIQTVYNQNAFEQIKALQNSRNIGVCFLDSYGQILLSDKQTRDILEINQNFSDSIFQLVCEAGSNSLQAQFQEESSLLGDEECETIVQYTIYSEKYRKKTMKQLSIEASRIPQKNSKPKKYEQQKTYITLNNEELIFIKYLKTIQVKIEKVNVTFNQNFLNSLGQQDDIQAGLYYPNSEEQVMSSLCFIQEVEYENISYQDLIKDSKIQIFEEKYQQKCQEIRQRLLTGQERKKRKASAKLSRNQEELFFEQQSQFSSFQVECLNMST